MKRTLIATALMCTAAASQAAIIGFEAESGTISIHNSGTINTIADASALGGQYIIADPAGTTARGQVQYDVTLAGGTTYALWTRVKAPNVNSDSFYAPEDEPNLSSGTTDFQTTPSVNVNNLHNTQSDGAFTWMLVGGSADTGADAGDYSVSGVGGGLFALTIQGREGVQIDAFAFVSEDEGFGGNALDGDIVATESEAEKLDAAVVPLPAAAWLFGSALIGLVGVARRKQPDNND